jgi:hypothetical protein
MKPQSLPHTKCHEQTTFCVEEKRHSGMQCNLIVGIPECNNASFVHKITLPNPGIL